jgi:tetratricopeptide (TPR) repeat protein
LVRTNDTRYILTGRVDHTNDALRLVLRLYERQQEMPMWTETFAGTTNEVPTLEQRAINAIARRLDLPVAAEVQGRIEWTLTNNLAAYGFLLRARSLYASGFRKDFQQAFADYSSAVGLDPLYVAAHGGLMMVRGDLSFEQGPRTAQPEIAYAAERILRIDDTVLLAHNRLAHKRLYYDYDWDASAEKLERMMHDWPEMDLEWAIWLRTFGRTNEAQRHHERLKRLPDPGLSEAQFIVLGELVWRHYDDALAAAHRMNELYPDGMVGPYTVGRACLAAGRYLEAIEWFRKAAPEGPGSELQGLLGRAYALAGDRTNALELLRQLEPRVGSGDADPYFLAWIYAGMGNQERAIDNLELAARNWRSQYITHADFGGLRTDPAWDAFQGDPRFEKLCESVGLGQGQWPR